MRPNCLSLYWPITKPCPKCRTRLLNTERNSSWCYLDRQFPSLQLRPYPPSIDALLSQGRASDISCKLNNLLSFCTIGVHGSFQNLPSPSTIVSCGRSYHRMLDIERGQYPLRWFLYAAEDRHQTAADIDVGSSIVQQIEQTMHHSNAYMDKFRLLRDQPPGVPSALELKNQPSTCSEIAATIHTNSIANSHPRSVYDWRNHPTPDEEEFEYILSSHYEHLEYPLLFLHTSPGWLNEFFPNLTQMKYYRMRWLQNDHRIW